VSGVVAGEAIMLGSELSPHAEASNKPKLATLNPSFEDRRTVNSKVMGSESTVEFGPAAMGIIG
jgi:hypothetical protein